MKTYIVQSSKSILKSAFNGKSKAERIQMMKDAHKEFRGIVEKFAAQHPGQITVGTEDAWINQTLKIEAEPAIAEKLSKVPGIGDVSAPRPITYHVITNKPAETRRPYGKHFNP